MVDHLSVYLLRGKLRLNQLSNDKKKWKIFLNRAQFNFHETLMAFTFLGLQNVAAFIFPSFSIQLNESECFEIPLLSKYISFNFFNTSTFYAIDFFYTCLFIFSFILYFCLRISHYSKRKFNANWNWSYTVYTVHEMFPRILFRLIALFW